MQTFLYSLPILLQTCPHRAVQDLLQRFTSNISKECLNNWFMRFIRFSLKATPAQLPCTVRSKKRNPLSLAFTYHITFSLLPLILEVHWQCQHNVSGTKGAVNLFLATITSIRQFSGDYWSAGGHLITTGHEGKICIPQLVCKWLQEDVCCCWVKLIAVGIHIFPYWTEKKCCSVETVSATLQVTDGLFAVTHLVLQLRAWCS